MLSAPDAPLLDVRDLNVRFRQGGTETIAVDGVSFTLKRGTTLALVGESGSGKSVTALSIVRLLSRAAEVQGQVLFKGEDFLAYREARLREIRGAQITMVFQEPMTSLNPLHTIERQIGEILELHGARGAQKIKDRIIELLQEVGIPDPAERLGAFPHQLSGGQRQRVMIAMALANRPDLFIADEPTTALDVTVQAQILDLLKELQARYDMAMLFITHDLNIVRKIADDVAVMQKGKIVETGTMANLRRPQHPYTRRSSPPSRRARRRHRLSDAKIIIAARTSASGFPIKRGLLASNRRLRQGGRWRLDLPCAKARRSASSANPARAKRRSASPSCGSFVARARSSFSAARSRASSSRRCGRCGATCRSCSRTRIGSLSPRLSVADIVAEGLGVQIRRMSYAPAARDRRARARRYRPRSGSDGSLSA